MIHCALVTGGTKGIGRSIVLKLFRDHGFHLLINYHNDELAAQQTMETLEHVGGSCELLKFDVTNKTNVEDVLGEWKESNPDKFISVLINNAGILRDGWFHVMPENNWDEVMDTSLKGFFYVTQFVVKTMLFNKFGRIINIASLSGVKGTPAQTNYSAAKAGLIGATKALAQEVAKMNITVNAVAPGFIHTGMTENIDKKKMLSLIPMGRIGEPDEVADIVSFLASAKASYITGEVINVNGGLYS